MQNHNEYLKRVEEYLVDLSIVDKSKILLEVNNEVQEKELKELEEPQILANKKRENYGFIPFKIKKPFSLFALFLKLTALMTVFFVIAIGGVVWKFYPFFKIDEEKNRVIILGGLIDIDGEAGKYKVLDEYHFSKDHFTNDLQATLALEDDMDEILVNFQSGSFTLANSKTNELKIDCKLASPAPQDMIMQSEEVVRINFNEIKGLSCQLNIPEDRKLSLDGKEGAITIKSPEFNNYIELENGKVLIYPESEIDYKYFLNVKNGFVGEFNSVETESAYEIQVNLENGSIIAK